ncbi:MAG TPA: hypothetical protein DD979_05355, partial [Gammaproteobacteria bacterium]|nr:hypothetical protein [Gammaproteobacteria bacterium]
MQWGQGMTPEQWTDVENELVGVFGSVELKVDGYDITLRREVSKNKIVTVVYVNGAINGENLDGNNPTEITLRFYRPISQYLFRMKKGQIREKEIKKARRNRIPEWAEILSKRFTYYVPTWNSTRSL